MKAMQNDHSISFGDNVLIRSTPLTQKLGLAGFVGNVQGETTPSVTGVEVIGKLREDYAIHVFFEDREEGYWFAPELLEFVDHAPGIEIRLEGVPQKWTRSKTGEWIESEAEDIEQPTRPWWKFW